MALPYMAVDYFGPEAHLKIRADFDCTCVLCQIPLAAGEGHFIPLMTTIIMFEIALDGLFHKVFKPFEAPNGLYACKPCACKWLSSAFDGCPWAVLVLCVPLMEYAHDVISSAKDDATRCQTLDEILETLKQDPRSTTARRKASPFLNCYQLLPVLAPDEFIPPPPTLVVHPTPSTRAVHKRGSTATNYHILERNGASVPSDTPPKHIPLYGQYEGGDITLWRIPMRSHGLMFGYAERAFFEDVYSSEVFEVFWKLRSIMLYNRRCPKGYQMPGAPSEDEVFRLGDLSPAEREAGAKLTQLRPIERDTSSGSNSDSTVEGEPKGSHIWSLLSFLASALKRWM